MNLYLKLVALALLAGVIGCGGKPTVGGADQVDIRQINNTISNLTDTVQDPAKFGGLFVTPPDAATLAKYKGYFYYSGGTPAVSGTTAKSKVRLEKPAGTLAGEPEWEFEKSGDAWKIKSAPLP